jgi:hypothetical protein
MLSAVEGRPEATAAPTSALERPIDNATEDKLERSGCIRRLCDALITRNRDRETGVIIGITGQWGSRGKWKIHH